MTERDHRHDDGRERRPHPLMGACIVRGGSQWGGEVIDIVRTSARYGDAMAIKIFPRRDGKPSGIRLLSISEISKDESPFLMFQGPLEAHEWMEAWVPKLAELYELDIGDPPG